MTTSPETTRRRAVAAVAVALALLATGIAASPAPAGAQPSGGCVRYDRSGKCVAWNENGGGEDGGGPSHGGGDPWMCTWTGPLDPAEGRAAWPEAPEEASYWVFNDCGYGGGNGTFDPWEQVGYLTGPWLTTMEIVPGPLPPPAPHEVAEDLWAQVEATLPAPELIVSPPSGRAAIVDHPTFLAVSNWTVVDEDDEQASRCGDDVRRIACVTLTAVPRLTFDPGDGSDPIACAGSGTVFDPTRDPDAQADAPGACAHRYTRRTGVAGRPDAWTATATVTWEVTWTSQNPTGSGAFPDFSLSTTIDRPVDELQGIVVDADGGLG